MRIAAVLGSPHGLKGATGTLMAEVVRGCREAGADVDVLSLRELVVNPCRACDACHKVGQCPQNDGFETVKTAMLAADGIVLASPNYIVSVSAQMKALLDRWCGPLHCILLREKYAVAVETSGGAGGEGVREYMLRVERMMGCWTVGSIGATGIGLADAARRQAAFAAAGELGRALVDAITRKKTYPEQVAERDAFFERMKMLIGFRKDEWAYERDHWKAKGWL
jgi:multimeric flavodoxin WrbA